MCVRVAGHNGREAELLSTVGWTDISGAVQGQLTVQASAGTASAAGTVALHRTVHLARVHRTGGSLYKQSGKANEALN